MLVYTQDLRLAFCDEMILIGRAMLLSKHQLKKQGF